GLPRSTPSRDRTAVRRAPPTSRTAGLVQVILTAKLGHEPPPLLEHTACEQHHARLVGGPERSLAGGNRREGGRQQNDAGDAGRGMPGVSGHASSVPDPHGRTITTNASRAPGSRS